MKAKELVEFLGVDFVEVINEDGDKAKSTDEVVSFDIFEQDLGLYLQIYQTDDGEFGVTQEDLEKAKKVAKELDEYCKEEGRRMMFADGYSLTDDFGTPLY